MPHLPFMSFPELRRNGVEALFNNIEKNQEE
jgi:hypothetical protein